MPMYRVLQGFNVPILEEEEPVGARSGKPGTKEDKPRPKPWELQPGDRITVEAEEGEMPEPPKTEFHMAGEEVELPEDVAARYLEISYLEEIEPEPVEGKVKGKKMRTDEREKDKPGTEPPPPKPGQQPPPPPPPQNPPRPR